ncbi:MAG: hypothetical protein KGH94_03855 [Candidatus Micrarchaeota archaeon]|nr:hypothetical protein [Candidatus Micrarchaeota archaeon]
MFKLQSAMEYLMTYGWTMLVIIVVVASLFYIGVFGTNESSGTHAAITPGYKVTILSFASNGVLSAAVGSAVIPLNVIATNCSSSGAIAPSYWPINGIIISIKAQTTQNLTFQCPVTSLNFGSSFTGTLWIEYPQNGQNQIIKVATMTATVTSK